MRDGRQRQEIGAENVIPVPVRKREQRRPREPHVPARLEKRLGVGGGVAGVDHQYLARAHNEPERRAVGPVIVRHVVDVGAELLQHRSHPLTKLFKRNPRLREGGDGGVDNEIRTHDLQCHKLAL